MLPDALAADRLIGIQMLPGFTRTSPRPRTAAPPCARSAARVRSWTTSRSRTAARTSFAGYLPLPDRGETRTDAPTGSPGYAARRRAAPRRLEPRRAGRRTTRAGPDRGRPAPRRRGGPARARDLPGRPVGRGARQRGDLPPRARIPGSATGSSPWTVSKSATLWVLGHIGGVQEPLDFRTFRRAAVIPAGTERRTPR